MCLQLQHQLEPRSERDDGAESDDGEDIAAMLEQESIIASEALDRAESAEAQVLNLRSQLVGYVTLAPFAPRIASTDFEHGVERFISLHACLQERSQYEGS